jgi:hypothetical protein
MYPSGATQIYNVGYCDVRFGDAVWVDWMAAKGANQTYDGPVTDFGFPPNPDSH